MKVLIVDDEPDVRALVRSSLSYARQDLTAVEAADGDEALAMIYSERPDLVVLDLALPRRDGFSVLAQVREKTDLPIIVLTARGLEEDKLKGLRLGADDYLTKPFSPRELVARIENVLRRASPQAPAQEIYRFSDVEVNIRSNEVRRGGTPVELSAKEFALLAYFVAHPAETLSRDRLLDAVWGYDNYPNTRTVDTHIVHLRQKLEPNPEEPHFILTIHGSGYKFVG